MSKGGIAFVIVIIILYLALTTFQNLIGKATQISELTDLIDNNRMVFVAYTTPWCKYCQELKPILEQVKADNTTDVKIYEFENADTVQTNIKVTRYPTLVIFMRGTPIGYNGPRTYNDIRNFIIGASNEKI